MESHSRAAGVFSIVHRVQFSETDMAGVVHFSNLFRWMEEIEHACFRSLGLSVAMQHDGIEIGWPRVSASCEYFAPARFEDQIDLRMRITKIGRKSLNYEVEFFRNDQLIARGKIATVCCTLANGTMTAAAIPPVIHDKLAGFISP